MNSVTHWCRLLLSKPTLISSSAFSVLHERHLDMARTLVDVSRMLSLSLPRAPVSFCSCALAARRCASTVCSLSVALCSLSSASAARSLSSRCRLAICSSFFLLSMRRAASSAPWAACALSSVASSVLLAFAAWLSVSHLLE